MNHQLLSPVGHEMLDDPDADPALVRESLHHLARSNAWFGGFRAARIGMLRLLQARRLERATLLDVGTGRGDIPRRLVEWAARRGVRLTALGADLHPAAAGLATRAGVPTAVADAFALPFPDRSIDVVLLSQIAHHFSAAGITALGREASRVARIGVVLADLRRSRPAQLAFQLGARLLRFDPITRTDGVTSLARGFSTGGLTRLLADAGWRPWVRRSLGARIIAVWSVSP
jgi:ubiquinone/menaquinone biosynthesis C-methylase UbiE